ncbi:hypothetical protein TTHERM_00151900 (macronuclear) [Tetrahymena thermophila SB210]|uniref:EF-hand domain-containing protein n=1 Tax=Tetrahymena thermophila (strain SB210) TaxID=312017 RepID=I7M9F3_TETTS|nr:hypothetical protein TTHERM_00151900 [Tetrahymena thermophila SB210]EAS01476.2 hypothetical protein TTHERM_00151900 [Tetrahymena thermophila SB210]|eukprot:XP_001021722.2 hypothetical protein TTHERM_00151900 [Tetrahymena thermophila SB210]
MKANQKVQKKVDKYKVLFNFKDVETSNSDLEINQPQQPIIHQQQGEKLHKSLSQNITKQDSHSQTIIKNNEYFQDAKQFKDKSINLPALNISNISKQLHNQSINDQHSIPKYLLQKIQTSTSRKKQISLSTQLINNESILKGMNGVNLLDSKTLRNDYSLQNLQAKNHNIKIMDMIQEDKKQLKDRTLLNLNDISYIQKSPKIEMDLKEASNSIIHFDGQLQIMNNTKKKKNNVYLQFYEISHENAKYDSDIDNIEKKIQIDRFYKEKDQENENQYIQNHKEILNNISLASNRAFNAGQNQFYNSSKATKTEENSIFQNSFSNLNETKTNRSQKNYLSGSNQRILTEGNDTSTTQMGSLQSKLPFQISNLPISRKDVQDLEIWLNDMLHNLSEQKDLPKQKLLDGYQVIYTACLKELIRQVKISCLERGTLFEKVWIAYTDLILKGQTANQQYHSKLEQEFLDDTSRLHKAYGQQIALLEQERKKDRAKLDEQQKEIQILTEATSYFKKKLLNADLEIKKHKNVEEDLRNQLEAVIQEKLKLKLINSEHKKQEKKASNRIRTSSKTSRFGLQSPRSSQRKEERDEDNSQDEMNQSQLSEDQPVEDDQEEVSQTPQYLHKIRSQNEEETKEEFKNSKISVVSHLLNRRNLIFNTEEENHQEKEDQDLQEELKNQINKTSQEELDFLIEQEANEEKREKLKQLCTLDDDDDLQYELREQEVQTEYIRLSECEQINVLIHELTKFDQVQGGDNSSLSTQYEKALEIIKTGEMQFEQKMEAVDAIKNALKQLEAYIKMSETLNAIANENIKLQNEKFEWELKYKESQVEIEDMKSHYKNVKQKYEKKNTMICHLQDELSSAKEKVKNEQKSIKSFFKGMVKQIIKKNQANDLEGTQQENQNIDDNQTPNEDGQEEQDRIKAKQLIGDQDDAEEKQDGKKRHERHNDSSSEGETDDSSDDEDDDSEDPDGQRRLSKYLMKIIQRQQLKHNQEQDRKQSLFVSPESQKNGKSIKDLLNSLIGIKLDNIKVRKTSKNSNFGSHKNSVNMNMSFASVVNKARASDDIRKKAIQQNMKMSIRASKQSVSPSQVQQQISALDQSMLNSKVLQKRFFSPNQEQSQKLVNSIYQQRDKIKKPELPMNTIIKFLSGVYQELVKNENSNRIPLHTCCYDLILQKYGLKTVAENKLKQIFKSLYFYRNQTPRLKSSAIYCGISDHYDDTNYHIYIKAIQYFYELQINQICNLQEDTLITYDKIYPFIDDFFKEKLGQKNYSDLVLNIKQTQHNQNLSSSAKVENGIRFETFMNIAISFYEKTKAECKKHVSEIFYACDLDKNDTIEYYEFDLMYKYVEKKKYDKQIVQSQFSEEADIINPKTGEKALTLNKFVDICIEKDLFSQKRCSEFCQVQNQNDDIKTIDDLCQNWNYRFKLLKYRFLKCDQYKPHIKAIIENLTEQLTNYNEKNAKIIWLSYRLIDQESINIQVEYETETIIQDIIPIKLQMLYSISSKFEEIL